MEFKGTTGKWKFYVEKYLTSSCVVSTMDGRGILITSENSNPFERKNNALLASKAPEMLEMLKRVNDSLLNDPSTIEQIDLRQEVEALIIEATNI